MVPALKTLAATAPDWRTRLHALWTLDGLDAIEVAQVEKALADANADVRAAAVRLSERWLGQDAALRREGAEAAGRQELERAASARRVARRVAGGGARRSRGGTPDA